MIRTIVRVAALLSTLASASASAQDFKVTLLGIGSPFPDPNRFSAATLVEAGQEEPFFGVGRSATIRLIHGPADGAINPVFITHFHSDHTSGLPDLWLTRSIRRPITGDGKSSGRREPRRSCRSSSGPTGTTYASAIST